MRRGLQGFWVGIQTIPFHPTMLRDFASMCTYCVHSSLPDWVINWYIEFKMHEFCLAAMLNIYDSVGCVCVCVYWEKEWGYFGCS